MKSSMVLVAGILLLLANKSVQARPVAHKNFTPTIETGMTAKECRQVFECCVCAQSIPGGPCIDWEGC